MNEDVERDQVRNILRQMRKIAVPNQVDVPALLALADRFDCGSSDYMTRKEVADAIRRAVGQ